MYDPQRTLALKKIICDLINPTKNQEQLKKSSTELQNQKSNDDNNNPEDINES